MDVDSSPVRRRAPSQGDAILKRLAQCGVPQKYLDQSQLGVVAFVRENKSLLPVIVSCILPRDEDISVIWRVNKTESTIEKRRAKLKVLFGESLFWVQWLMFEEEPHGFLKNVARNSSGQRAVCGAVWGRNDLAYHCRTCEYDPTCAICVPCFQNGDHSDHDYSIIYTSGGCCDCGDATAWKREGFCSSHKGSEQIQPLPNELVRSIGPVLDVLFLLWKDKSLSVESCRPPLRDDAHANVHGTHEFSLAIIEMLLNFCNSSESLLSFVAKRMFTCSGLLDVLLKGERFLDELVVKKLHEVLLKFLGEPLFKYEFAKAFMKYYQTSLRQIIKECSDSMLEQYPLISTFSVQIFTVATLAPRLVQEINLLDVLLGCLWDLFLSCVGEDGRLQAKKWESLCEIAIRLIEDIRHVLSHEEVRQYVSKERVDISRSWIRLLSLIQGMDAQKRVRGVHTEEENENLHNPFVLVYYLRQVNALIVSGAFSVVESKESKNDILLPSVFHGLEDDDRLRHAKVGRLSQESFAGKLSGRNVMDHEDKSERYNHISLPSSGVWLIVECLKAVETWLSPGAMNRNNPFSMDVMSSSGYKVSNSRKKKFFRIKKGSNSNRAYRTCLSREVMDVDQVPINHASAGSPPIQVMTQSRVVGQCDNCVSDTSKTSCKDACMSEVFDDNSMEMDYIKESETLGLLSLANWPDIVYDVSSQEISFHIPLHHLLSALFQKAMTSCYAGMLEMSRGISSFPSCVYHHKFFGQVLGGFHPHGFSAFLMEHPLRLRVFCAQVRAGMWRRNGDAAILSSECYRSSTWLYQGLEFDLFLLQCCAALAPSDQFVKRIQDRFGLSDYTSLDLRKHNDYASTNLDTLKYEPVLVQEMLTLIIQIVKERQFCGLSTFGYLCRELIHKLATGDATHSQLLKAIPCELSKSEQLLKALDMLTIYSNPSGMKQGKYSLRELYWKELDLYHPRWNSRELQVAEERYGRFCNVSALNVQLPQWSEIFCPLITVSRIATSRATLQIIRAVIYYALFANISSANRAPDSVLITALHLLALALDICEKSKVCAENSGDNVDLSCTDDRSCIDASCYSKDLLLVLSFACEEFDMGAVDGSVFWKNQNMLSLLVSLLRKYREGKNKRYTEIRQCNISSLIENLLKKFVQLSAACMAEIKQLEPELVYNMSEHSNTAMKNFASDSCFDEQRAKIREHQAAILEKMRAAQSKFIASMKGSSKDDLDALESNQQASMSDNNHVQEQPKQICSFCRDPESQSPFCYLIHLQKSKLTSFIDRGPLSWEDDCKLAEVRLISEDVPSVLSGADSASTAHSIHTIGLEVDYDMEPAEINSFLEFFIDQIPDIKEAQPPNVVYGAEMKLSLEMVEFDIYQSVERKTRRTKSNPDAVDGNSLCSASHGTGGLGKGKSAEFSLVGEYLSSLSRGASKQHQSSVYNVLCRSNTLSNSLVPATILNGFGPRDFDGIHLSSCGHVVHQECHQRYLLSLKQRSFSRIGVEGGYIVDPVMGELLCPVCRRFTNSILPVFPVSANKAQRQMVPSTVSAAHSEVSSSLNGDALHLELALTLLQSTAEVVGHGKFLKMYSGDQGRTTELALEPVVHKLCLLHYPHNYGSFTASGRLRPSLMLWDTLTFSLMSLEVAARGKLNPHSFTFSCLESLYNELHSSDGSILSSLLCISQTSRSMNDLEVLLRFRAIQLFSGSICSGFSDDLNLSNKGLDSSILEQTDHGETFPDTQFWKRATDPILAYDPFSSLMLVLFSLPLPFLSSTEFFMALVHLFYVVSVVQAILTCYSNCYFDVSCFGDWILNDVCKAIGKSELARKHYFSDCMDSSVHPKDVIRRLTLPYLRRCALLWQLIQSSNLAPSCNDSHSWKGLISCTDNASVVDTTYLAIELTSVRELEKLFQVCSLEVILKDELVRTLTIKWCQHVCEKFKVHKHENVYYCSPAIPFKLMQLPRLYHDLLQRYVKLQCSHCKFIPDEPALCLLCGKLCSPSWKCCCRESRCLEHAMICGAGIGVFLLVRKTTILLQRSERHAFWSSPYLDAYGEEDLEMARGKALYLNEDRYKALAYLVSSHSIDHTSEILRRTTIGPFVAD